MTGTATTTVVSPLAESRPRAHRWQASQLPACPPDQPALDLRPALEPVVLAWPADLAASEAPGLPDARAWSVALATAVLEVLMARRSPTQLSRWLAEDVLTALVLPPPGRRGGPDSPSGHPAGPGAAGHLQSVRLQYPRTGVAEVAVHARLGPGSLAMALRLEAVRSRWLCTALELAPGSGGRRAHPT